jgi:hypothetical protein
MAGNAGHAQNSLRDSIRSYTQQLIDGIATGNAAAWEKYLDDSCLITTEDGSVKSKRGFIKGIGIPPAYLSVSETISDPIFTIHPGVVVFCYRANLLLKLAGQQRLNEICQTDTWIKTNNDWKLICTAAFDKPNLPEPLRRIQDDSSQLSGRYQLTENAGYQVYTDSGMLFIRPFGRGRSRLIGESGDMFFTPGKPLTRYVFVRDEKNNIIQLNVRRAGRDLIYPKTQ